MTLALALASRALALSLALAAPALAQPRAGGPPRQGYANPSAGIAADIERGRLTGEKKGRWFALRQTAAPDAVMFVPQMVLAQTWLKGRTDRQPGYRLRPFSAWASCDGSLIVTSGAWAEGNRDGWYTTVWQRQPDGVYRWVFDHGGLLDKPLAEPEMLEARVAECPPRKVGGPPPVPPAAGKRAKAKPAPIVLDPTGRHGRSGDGSLIWQVTAGPNGARHFLADMLINGRMEPIRDEKVPPAGS